MADPSSLYGGYLKASTYSGIKDADLKAALKPYKIGLRWARGAGFSDTQMRSMAARGVVKKYLLSKSKKKMPANYTGLSIKQLQSYLK